MPRLAYGVEDDGFFSRKMHRTFEAVHRPFIRHNEVYWIVEAYVNKKLIFHFCYKISDHNFYQKKTLITIVVYDHSQNVPGFQTNTLIITQSTCFQSFLFLSLKVWFLLSHKKIQVPLQCEEHNQVVSSITVDQHQEET